MNRITTAIALALALIGTASGCEMVPPTRTPAYGCANPATPTDLWIVNTQPYHFGELDAVATAYQLVAANCGWSEAAIAAWEPFIVGDLIAKESGGCWQIKGGTRYNAIGDLCGQPAFWGNKSDTGVGQVTPVLFRRPDSTICKATGMCTAEQILSSPWTSMVATLVVVEAHGRQPWCWNAWARRFHNCAIAPAWLPLDPRWIS